MLFPVLMYILHKTNRYRCLLLSSLIIIINSYSFDNHNNYYRGNIYSQAHFQQGASLCLQTIVMILQHSNFRSLTESKLSLVHGDQHQFFVQEECGFQICSSLHKIALLDICGVRVNAIAGENFLLSRPFSSSILSPVLSVLRINTNTCVHFSQTSKGVHLNYYHLWNCGFCCRHNYNVIIMSTVTCITVKPKQLHVCTT